MKTYDVTITETLRLTVPVQAESLAEAEETTEENWKNSQYILDAENFAGADFKGKERIRDKDLGR